MTLSWFPPPASLLNGVIREYKIDVSERDTKNTLYLKSQSTKMTLEHLHPYYSYDIRVAAVTVGVGPYATISMRTLEDGENPLTTSLEYNTITTIMLY